MIPPEEVEVVDDFAELGVHAFTTTRAVGSFSTGTEEPVKQVMARWDGVRATVATFGIKRFATAPQVHGTRVMVHGPGWDGWLRAPHADGHVATDRATALGVTIADCVPVFLAHPGGAVGILHSGWRGTASRIVGEGIAAMEQCGFPIPEIRMHLGPAICGKCYEVSPEVFRSLTGADSPVPATVDLRALIASHARESGVRHISVSRSCTRCDNARFFSHRAGDAGRQLSVITAVP